MTHRPLSIEMLRDDTLVTGWIDPDGRWYGCRPEDHDEFMHLYLEKEVKDAEREGWIRVRSGPDIDGWFDKSWCCGDGWDAVPTAAQRNRLLAMGHLTNDPSEVPDESFLIDERPVRGCE